MKKKKRSKNYSRMQGVYFLIKIPQTKKTLTFYKKTRVTSIASVIKETEWQIGVFLEVVYQKGVANSYTLHSKVEFLKALNDWTEKEQVDYCTGGEW